MFSRGQSRKTTPQSKDLFGAFAPSTKILVRSVVKPKPVPPTPTQTKLNAPRTSSPLSAAPSRPSSAASTSSSKPTAPPPKPKRKRAHSSDQDEPEAVKKPRRSRALERVSSPAPSRSARSSLPRSSGHAFGSLEKPVPRSEVVIEEDGNVPHVSSEDVVLRFMAEGAGGKKGKKGYTSFFKNPADPEDKTFEPGPPPPFVQLEYPNLGASERFLLLSPLDRDDYQPIRELMRTIGTIADCYLTPVQRIPLGSLSSSNSLSIIASASARASPSPSRPPSTAPYIDGSTPTPEAGSNDPLLRTLEKALHTRNGPLFAKTVEAISSYLKSMKQEMLTNARTFFNSPPLGPISPTDLESEKGKAPEDARASRVLDKDVSTAGVPVKLWKTIMEEVYQRSVGPDVEDTKKYKSFSSETYGELNPIFVSDLIHRFGLGPGKTFVDLGCGVGNCVLQAALQAGCDSYGIELNPPVAALSFIQQREFNARLRMWGLNAGPVTLREGDFTESAEVSEWIRKADVVLVNNYIFSSDLNDALTWRFLDLREGAKVVVLKPFWPLNRPLTERTAYTPEAVLAAGVERIEYITDSVSWTKEPGEFFIYTKSEGRAITPSGSSRPSRR